MTDSEIALFAPNVYVRIVSSPSHDLLKCDFTLTDDSLAGSDLERDGVRRIPTRGKGFLQGRFGRASHGTKHSTSNRQTSKLDDFGSRLST